MINFGRNIIRSKNFIVFLLYIGVAVFVIPYIGKNLPYSVYYNSVSIKEDYKKILAENSQRLLEANVVIRRLLCSGKCLQLKNEAAISPEFCFVIITVSRPQSVNYLTQVVAALLPQLSTTDSVFTVYNAEGPSHVEAMNLSAVIPVYSRITGTMSRNTYDKEKEDYVCALDWCQRKKPRFTVILEDDALPPHDFLQRLKFILDHRMSRKKKWLFLKLFYPEKWQGWAKEWNIVTELIVSSSLIGLMLTLATYFLQIMILRANISRLSIMFRFVFSCLLILYILVSLGRPHWIALRKIDIHLSSVVEAPGCCTPGVLYSQLYLSNLIKYLNDTKCSQSFPVDLALEQFAERNYLDRLLVIPNLVKHIGFVSTLPGKRRKNPREFRIK